MPKSASRTTRRKPDPLKIRLLLPVRHIRRVVRKPVAEVDLIDELPGEREIIRKMLLEQIKGSELNQARKPPHPNSTNQRVLEISSFECAPEQSGYLPPCARVLRVLKSNLYDDTEEGNAKLRKWTLAELKAETSSSDPSHILAVSEEFSGFLGKSDFRGEIFFGLDWWPCLPSFANQAARAYKVNSHHRIFQIDVSRIAECASVQVDTSYEKTIADLLTFFAGDSIRNDVREFFFSGDQQSPVWLMVRIGNAAVGMFKFSATGVTANLCFHVNRPAPTRPTGLGDMTAYRWILMTSILCSISQSTSDFALHLKKGVKSGVYASHACFLGGFGINFDGTKQLPRSYFADDAKPADLFGKYVRAGLSLFLGDINEAKFRKNRSTARKFPADIVLPDFDIGGQLRTMRDVVDDVILCPVDSVLALSKNVFWRLSSACAGWPEAKGDNFSEHLDKAIRVVKISPKKSKFPIVRIGKLELIDRFEIQDYLFLNGLLQDYAEDQSRDKPLSISVFGQPGSGKSFGVRELVKAMSGGRSLYSDRPITFNLSQLRSVPDLIAAFHQIRDACLRGPIPLIFFDEFDSLFEGEPFGWLKYFLAPMEDGEFSEARSTFHFGRAVFVFAGGVNHTFSEFNERARNPQFCTAKGPDFISRLRGVLNIRSINRPEDDSVPDGIYLQRRAYILWQALKQKTGLSQDAATDQVINAFIRVGRFKHGIRSLKAIIEMSRVGYGKRLSVGQLPPHDQLEMHVDAREFLAFASAT